MSDTSICNLALSHIGNISEVKSIDPPDSSAEARKCAAFYPIAKDAALAYHNWTFTKRSAALSDIGDPIDGWLYRYRAPTEMLKPLVVTESGLDVPMPFEMEGDDEYKTIILTNAKNAILKYTKSINDESQFPPLLELAISHLLASFLAGSIPKDAKRSDAELKKYEIVIEKAKTADSNSGKTSKVDQNPRNYIPAGIRARR